MVLAQHNCHLAQLAKNLFDSAWRYWAGLRDFFQLSSSSVVIFVSEKIGNRETGQEAPESIECSNFSKSQKKRGNHHNIETFEKTLFPPLNQRAAGSIPARPTKPHFVRTARSSSVFRDERGRINPSRALLPPSLNLACATRRLSDCSCRRDKRHMYSWFHLNLACACRPLFIAL